MSVLFSWRPYHLCDPVFTVGVWRDKCSWSFCADRTITLSGGAAESCNRQMPARHLCAGRELRQESMPPEEPLAMELHTYGLRAKCLASIVAVLAACPLPVSAADDVFDVLAFRKVCAESRS